MSLIDALILSGCATSTPPSTPPTRPPLDSARAARCPVTEHPVAADYDVWQAWAFELLRQYAECAARHVKTVQARSN
ncbi:hypothetical protein ABIB38_002839 [Massilia sp. UYP11]|uniref:hypothetical protein n=1 Tax=Massilia sp. UYP11 TaxID=1756385 RepID=UPI003D2234AF